MEHSILQNKQFDYFRWLDKLGVAAANDVDLVIRQSFYGGSYGLIRRKTFHPTPVSFV